MIRRLRRWWLSQRGAVDSVGLIIQALNKCGLAAERTAQALDDLQEAHELANPHYSSVRCYCPHAVRYKGTWWKCTGCGSIASTDNSFIDHRGLWFHYVPVSY